ncbi:hypothetical protein ACVI1N_000193 [Sinorhizobium medicae]
MLRIATTALAIAGGFLASAANGVHPPKLIRQILPLVIGFAMLAASPLKAADMSDSELEISCAAPTNTWRSSTRSTTSR